jgi:hypothetical protein
MADKKISALPAASTPLAGSEVLPIVQGGITEQVSVANLTAGRGVSGSSFTTTAGNFVAAENFGLSFGVGSTYVYGSTTNGFIRLDVNNATAFGVDSSRNATVNVGNVVIGTAGKGIDFSANTHAAGMTSELLNWYEEGTWTATVTAESGTITTYTTEASYTRVGKIVSVRLAIRLANVGSASGALIFTGLPFATRNYTDNYPASTFLVRETWVSGDAYQGFIADNSSTGYIVSMAGDAINWSNDAVYVFEATYMCA